MSSCSGLYAPSAEIRDARHRRVAAAAAHAQTERRAHLLRHRAEVVRVAAQLDPVAGALVDQVVAAHCVAVLLAQPRRAEPGADLFVGGRAEDQVAGRLEALARERRDRHRLGRDLPLHVECAAPPHLAVAQLTAKRIGVPLRSVREHDVGVRKEKQGRAVAAPRDARNEIRALGDLGVQLAGDAGVFEVVAQQLRGRRLVARRIRRVDANEPLEELRHLLSQRRRDRHQLSSSFARAVN
jgi:hypothetical protein